MKQRIVIIAFVPIAFVGLVSTVSSENLLRIISFSAESKGASKEALESSASRRYLLEKSIEYAPEVPNIRCGA